LAPEKIGVVVVSDGRVKIGKEMRKYAE